MWLGTTMDKAILPAAVAGGFIALGLVLILAAFGIKIEFGGGKVVELQGVKRTIAVAIGGLILFGWGLYSVLPKDYEITEITVTPESAIYTRPCPTKFPVSVAVHARSAPGDVQYVAYLPNTGLPKLHRGKLGKNGTGGFTTTVPIPAGATGRLPLTARTVFPNQKRTTIDIELNC
jgi:hypothetical protein